MITTHDTSTARLRTWITQAQPSGVQSIVAYVGNDTDLGNCSATEPVVVTEDQGADLIVERVMENLDELVKLWGPHKNVLVRFKALGKKNGTTPIVHSERCDINQHEAPRAELAPRGSADPEPATTYDVFADRMKRRTIGQINLNGEGVAADSAHFTMLLGVELTQRALAVLAQQNERQAQTIEEQTRKIGELAEASMRYQVEKVETQVRADADKVIANRAEAGEAMKIELIRMVGGNLDKLIDLGISSISGKMPTDPDSVRRFVEGYAAKNPEHMRQITGSSGAGVGEVTPAMIMQAIRDIAQKNPNEAVSLMSRLTDEVDQFTRA